MIHAKTLRDTARGILAGIARFDDFEALRTWARSIDDDAIPGWCVVTPRTRQTKDGVRSYTLDPDLEIQVRRAGGDDLEDILDEDAGVVEEALLPALALVAEAPELVLIETTFHNGGERRLGFLNMRFTARKLITKTL